MTRLEAILAVQEAQELIIEAQNLVNEAIEYSILKHHFDAYGGYGFDQLLGNGNPHDSSLQTIIDEL